MVRDRTACNGARTSGATGKAMQLKDRALTGLMLTACRMWALGETNPR